MTPEASVIERLFMVQDKVSQGDVPFILNSAQRAVDNNWRPRILVPKARQEGVSTYFLARNVVRCLGVRNTRAVVISHEADATERLLMRVRYFLDNIRGPKALLRNNSRNEMTFPKTNSMFYIGTAGSRKFGRGDTITDLHCSEVAYWPDAKTLMTGLLQAVPRASGRISVESTGNGMGDWYHNACMRAAKGQSSFGMCFLPWHTFPEYTMIVGEEEAREIMGNLRPDLEEPESVAAYHLTPGQVAWRRIVIEDELDGDLYKWKQEYPSCLDDCFQAAGASFFQQVQYQPTPDWERRTQFFWALRGHPDPKLHYVIGGDVSAGVGKDFSVAEVICLETGEQVGEWLSNHTEPDVFAEHLASLGTQFNKAFMCVESNNHGILTLAYLRGIGGLPPLYPPELVYRTPKGVSRSAKDQVRRVIDLGQRTTKTSKPYALGLLRKALRKEWVIHSPVLKSELSSFKEMEDGSLGAAQGCFDDTVIAMAMARFVFEKAAVLAADNPPSDSEILAANPQSFDRIVDELLARHHGPGELPFPAWMVGGGIH